MINDYNINIGVVEIQVTKEPPIPNTNLYIKHKHCRLEFLNL